MKSNRIPEYFFPTYYLPFLVTAISSLQTIILEERTHPGCVPADTFLEILRFFERVADAKNKSPEDPASALNAYLTSAGILSKMMLERGEHTSLSFEEAQDIFARFLSFWQLLKEKRDLSHTDREVAVELRNFLICFKRQAEG